MGEQSTRPPSALRHCSSGRGADSRSPMGTVHHPVYDVVPRGRATRFEACARRSCVVSCLLRLSDVMTSHDTGECVCQMGELLILPAGGVPWSLWWLPASSGCTARGWGATGRELGVLGVGGAFVQYAQPLASRSRLSWNRPTRAKSGQLWEGPKPNPDHPTLRRRRAGSGGGGPVTGAPGRAARTPDSLLRGRCPQR